MARFCAFDDRSAITVSGGDRITFLQGLVSNDVARTERGEAVWAALLTPQGKFRHEMFIVPDGASPEGPRLLLECEAGERMMDLGRTLRRYVLRADATLGIADGTLAFALWDEADGAEAAAAVGLGDDRAVAPFAGGIVYRDPRLPALGLRLLAQREAGLRALEEAGLTAADRTDWDAHRIPLGVPDGARDMEPEKATLLENGFDELNGVDWDKGCYMGQELTARTKYRGLVKKRLLPVVLDGPPPAEGSAVTAADGREVGTLRSVCGRQGLALLRLDRIGEGARLTVGEAAVTPRYPDWFAPPETAGGTAGGTAD
jgi:folate-binding protein YgfZ